jgi:hypothetical protein
VIDTSSSDTVRRIRKVGRYHLALFLLPVLSLLFYGWLRAPHLNDRPDNPQRTAPLYLRGRILDREGRPLAHTVDEMRVYPQGESVGSLVGYQLRGRNHTGLEAAIQDRLSPPLPPATLRAAIEQDSQVRQGQRSRLRGPDAQVSIDAELQVLLYEALQPTSGTVVVSDRQGHILAAVSSPSFDPNRVRDQWQQLRSDPRSPFIERVGSGLYPVTRPDGSALSDSPIETHQWLSGDPFPGYPQASSATMIEGRLFLTPLMLLELSYWFSDIAPAPGLVLVLPGSSEPSSNEPIDLELEPLINPGNMTSWELGAPSFRDSPPFIAVLGNVDGEVFFSLVIEDREAVSRDAQQRIQDLLLREVQGR